MNDQGHNTTRLQIQWNSVNYHQFQLGNKTKFQALKLIRKPALHIVNSPKKVKAVVYKTFKFLLALLSSSGEEDLSKLDQEQEGGDEDDFEEDN